MRKQLKKVKFMAHAYIPGLKVLTHSEIEKQRILPIKGKVLIESGAKVEPDDVIAQTNLPGDVEMLNVANRLDIEPADILDLMQKSEGETVEKGETIAESKGIFGLFKSSLESPVNGTVESISSVTGQVVIRQAPTPIEVDAYIRGVVGEILSEEGAIVNSYGALIQGIFGIGGEKRGEIVLAVNSSEQRLEADMIQSDFAGKVVVGGSFCTKEAFQKANEIGVSAIVVGGFDYADLKEILGYTLGVAITGAEELNTTLILTEGFGEIPMAGRAFRILKDMAGKQASVNGATQIRAGVIRPEIIIPHEDKQTEISDKADHSVHAGSLVRVIRAPYFGEIGEIVDLPEKLSAVESETLVRTAKIKLKSEEVVMVPRANLELLEV